MASKDFPINTADLFWVLALKGRQSFASFNPPGISVLKILSFFHLTDEMLETLRPTGSRVTGGKPKGVHGVNQE